MLSYIKEKLLEQPELIRELLEHYGFANIKMHNGYISFGRDQDSSAKSISIFLKDNNSLIVKDWARNITADIFSYIVRTRSVNFRNVISEAKHLVGIDGYYYGENVSTAPFGGFYKSIKNRKQIEIKTYDESILDKYVSCGNRRFLRDYISLETQHKFNIGYDIESQSITIPIYDESGQLMGVKCRSNYDDCEQKYWYDVPCSCSLTLYNYSMSYEYLESADVIYVTEAEKGCLQAYTFGYKNFVGLGSGSISRKQVQMLLSLNPKRIVFLHDVGYKLEFIMRNIQMVQCYSRMKQIEVGYWDNENKGYDDKISATDMGKEMLDYILENEIKYV